MWVLCRRMCTVRLGSYYKMEMLLHTLLLTSLRVSVSNQLYLCTIMPRKLGWNVCVCVCKYIPVECNSGSWVVALASDPNFKYSSKLNLNALSSQALAESTTYFGHKKILWFILLLFDNDCVFFFDFSYAHL